MHDVARRRRPQGHDRGAAAGHPAAVRARLRSRATRRQKFGGKPVWRYYDAVALSLYPLAEVRRPDRRPGGLDQAAQRRPEGAAPLRRPVVQADLGHRDQLRPPERREGGTAAARSPPPGRPPTWSAPTCCRPRTTSSGSPGTATTGGGSPVAAPSATRCSPTPTTPRRVTAAGRAYVMVQRWMHGTLLGRPGQPPVRQGLARHLHLRGLRLLRHPADLLEPVPPGQGDAGRQRRATSRVCWAGSPRSRAARG